MVGYYSLYSPWVYEGKKSCHFDLDMIRDIDDKPPVFHLPKFWAKIAATDFLMSSYNLLVIHR